MNHCHIPVWSTKILENDRLMVFSEFQPCLLLGISSDVLVGTMEDFEIHVGSVFCDELFFLNYP